MCVLGGIFSFQKVFEETCQPCGWHRLGLDGAAVPTSFLQLGMFVLCWEGVALHKRIQKVVILGGTAIDFLSQCLPLIATIA